MSCRTDQYYSICSQVSAALGYICYPNNEWLDTDGPSCTSEIPLKRDGSQGLTLTPCFPPWSATLCSTWLTAPIQGRKKDVVTMTTAHATPAWMRASDKYHSRKISGLIVTGRYILATGFVFFFNNNVFTHTDVAEGMTMNPSLQQLFSWRTHVLLKCSLKYL